ncbi:TGACG motif-binding factor 6, partial [Striga asiatica]
MTMWKLIPIPILCSNVMPLGFFVHFRKIDYAHEHRYCDEGRQAGGGYTEPPADVAPEGGTLLHEQGTDLGHHRARDESHDQNRDHAEHLLRLLDLSDGAERPRVGGARAHARFVEELQRVRGFDSVFPFLLVKLGIELVE